MEIGRAGRAFLKMARRRRVRHRPCRDRDRIKKQEQTHGTSVYQTKSRVSHHVESDVVPKDRDEAVVTEA